MLFPHTLPPPVQSHPHASTIPPRDCIQPFLHRHPPSHSQGPPYAFGVDTGGGGAGWRSCAGGCRVRTREFSKQGGGQAYNVSGKDTLPKKKNTLSACDAVREFTFVCRQATVSFFLTFFSLVF
eukprot:Hpha_TRINITY_DN15719_c2_g1::TRINITY_DN15719_c2_g1_i1::g.36788::m.36788